MRKNWRSLLKKVPKIVWFVGFLIFLVLLQLFLTVIFPSKVPVRMVGPIEFEGAQVFVDGKLIAVMVEANDGVSTYARDINSKKDQSSLSESSDILQMNSGIGNVQFIIITEDGRKYEKTYRDLEDISYFTHSLEEFELVEELSH